LGGLITWGSGFGYGGRLLELLEICRGLFVAGRRCVRLFRVMGLVSHLSVAHEILLFILDSASLAKGLICRFHELITSLT